MTDKRGLWIPRRRWLAAAGSSLSVALAGCLSGDDTGVDDDDGDANTDSDAGNGGDDGNEDGDVSDDGDENGDDGTDGNSDEGEDGNDEEVITAEIEVTVYSNSASEAHLAESGMLLFRDSDGEVIRAHDLEETPTATYHTVPHDTYTLETEGLYGDPLLDGSMEVVLDEDTAVDFVTVGHDFPGADSYRFTLYEYRIHRDPDPAVNPPNDQFFGFGTTAANGERFLMYDDAGDPQHIHPGDSPLPWGTDFTEVDFEPFALNTRQQVTDGDTTYHRKVIDTADFPDWEVLDHFNGHIRWSDELSRFQVIEQGLYEYIHDGQASFIENHGEIELDDETLHLYEIQGGSFGHWGERVYVDSETGHVRRWEIEEEPISSDPETGVQTEEIRLSIVEFDHHGEFDTLEDEEFNFDSGFSFDLDDARSI